MRVAFVAANSPRVVVRLAGPREAVEIVGLIDTGASLVMVPRKLAERLGHDLAGAHTMEVRTANGIVDVLSFRLTEVAIGDAAIEGVEAVCHAAEDGDVPVLVGLSFLRHFVVTLDFKRGYLVLEED